MNKQWLWFALALLVLTLMVFREVLPPDQILFTTDDNVGQIASRKEKLPEGWLGGWRDHELMGYPAPVFLGSTNLLLWFVPAIFFNNWINAFDLVMGSIFLVLFLRRRGVGWAPCVLGALTAYWLGSNFTLVYAGHIGKFGVLLWAAVYLWLVEKVVRERTWPWYVLAGGAMGMMFIEQADVGLFFALVLGPYAVYAFIREQGWLWRPLAQHMAVLAGVAFLLAFHPLWTGYRTAVVGVAVVQPDDPDQQWEYITQWSWPPEESIDFIAPGFMGWRTGEPEGPYVGRMGRSAGWEETGHGMRNFKLENQYIGAIPMAFAILAGILAWRRRTSGQTLHHDACFWSVALIVTLLLSFGKYFPLYTLFFQLPVVSSIRNPNKFLQVFQLALAILASCGFHHVLKRTGEFRGQPVADASVRPFVIVLVVLGGLMGLWALGSMAAWGGIVERLAQQGWGGFAEIIVRNRLWSLGHGAFMLFLAAAGIYLLACKRDLLNKGSVYLAWGLIGFVVFDVLFLARHYVHTMRAGAVERNAVVDVLKTAPHQRTALITQEGFYNLWLTYLFPYHHVSSINVAQMPRMPEDYQSYLSAMGQNPIRLWQLGAVQFILGPGALWGQIQDDPQLQEMFELVRAYNVDQENGVLTVRGGTEGDPGRHVLLRVRALSPRFAVVGGWEVADDQRALRMHARQQVTAFERVLVAPEWADDLPAPTASGLVGAVRVMEYRPGYMHLSVSCEEPAILRVAEKFDPDWRAIVDGEPAPVRRVDFISQGIFLGAGQHNVILRYAPPRGSFMVQIAGMLVCVAALTGLVRARSNGRAAE